MKRRIYLDYASTTPLDKKVLKAMLPYMTANFANPSALYQEALKTKAVIKDARHKIAQILAIKPEEIIFTASGTESDNLALIGVFNKYKKSFKPHIITTNIEHPGILETCKYLETEGCEISYIPVDERGMVNPQDIKSALKATTVLVSAMYANNEIGTVQPLREISRVIQEFKKTQPLNIHYPYFHTDASQAGNYLDLSFQKLGVDMMTLDASKFYGPKGIGLLASKKYIELAPVIHGGGQEKGLRAGTENIPAIIGMAEALSISQDMREKETERLVKLKEYFISNVIKYVPNVIINGDTQRSLPNTVNICIPKIDAEFAVIKLDHEGIACSSASACMNLSKDSYSYVIEALDKAHELAKKGKRDCKESSLRFTFGRSTSLKELSLTLAKIQTIIITQ